MLHVLSQFEFLYTKTGFIEMVLRLKFAQIVKTLLEFALVAVVRDSTVKRALGVPSGVNEIAERGDGRSAQDGRNEFQD